MSARKSTDILEFPVLPGVLGAEEIRAFIGRDNPVILEVGANCGQTTARLLQCMPGATIHAFEPEPRAIARFRDNISSPQVHLHECAIGATNGTVTFHQSSVDDGNPAYDPDWDLSGSIRSPRSHLEVWPSVKFATQIQVPIMTLDTWAERHGINAVDFIWADVQGAEGDLVDGGARLLRSTRYLYTEYSNSEWFEGQIDLPELVRRLPDFELLRRYPMDALLRNTRLSPPAARALPGKVFCIGFNKTGTTSIDGLFIELGLRSYHGYYSHLPVTDPIFQAAQCFSDGDQHDFALLDRTFPDSRFIVTTRRLDEWLISRVRHVEYRRSIGATGIMRQEYEADPAQAIRRWAELRLNYHQRVIEHFADRPGALLVIDICDGADPVKATGIICSFLGIVPGEGVRLRRANARETPQVQGSGTSTSGLRSKAEVRDEVERVLAGMGLPPGRQRSIFP